MCQAAASCHWAGFTPRRAERVCLRALSLLLCLAPKVSGSHSLGGLTCPHLVVLCARSLSIEVRGPSRDLHSGNEGGVFTEPLADLSKVGCWGHGAEGVLMLRTLKPGLVEGPHYQHTMSVPCISYAAPPVSCPPPTPHPTPL